MKEEKGRQAGCPGKGSRGDMTHKGEDGLAVEGVFDDSHVAYVRLVVRLPTSSPQPDGRASSSSLAIKLLLWFTVTYSQSTG